MINIKGKVPNEFFIWFEEKYKLSVGKEKDMLSKVDICEVD